MAIFAIRCPWHIAGPVTGLQITGLLWAINKPLGALGGYVDAVRLPQAEAAGQGCRHGVPGNKHLSGIVTVITGHAPRGSLTRGAGGTGVAIRMLGRSPGSRQHRMKGKRS